jgi:modulator of FtsH protease HflC
MTRSLPIAIGVLFVLILVAFNTTYTVNFHELAILTRFGKPAGVDREAGLHLKLPFFIDQVTRLDTRMQMVESSLETVQLTDDQQVVIQAFVLWRVDTENDEGAMDFFTAFGSLDAANRALEQELPSAIQRMRTFKFGDLIGAQSKLSDAESIVLAELQGKKLPGVKPISVGINQVVLPPKAAFAVLGRMAEVQVTLAREQESRGTSEAKALESTASSEAETIKVFAEQWATEIRSRGDTEAARYYSKMNEYGDLAVFLKWIDTLKAGMTGATTIITDTNQAPMHLFDMASPTNANGIPQPKEGLIPNAPASTTKSSAEAAAPPTTEPVGSPTRQPPAQPKEGS